MMKMLIRSVNYYVGKAAVEDGISSSSSRNNEGVFTCCDELGSAWLSGMWRGGVETQRGTLINLGANAIGFPSKSIKWNSRLNSLPTCLPACPSAIDHRGTEAAYCLLLSWAERTIIIVIPSLPGTLRGKQVINTPSEFKSPILAAVALYTMKCWSYVLPGSFSTFLL